MWCGSSDAPRSPNGAPEPHHRVVRIPPGESVVLNSAERAPYLLLVEILHGDLDFEPSKRGNKEILRKMALKDMGRKDASSELPDWSGAPRDRSSAPGSKEDVAQDALGKETTDVPSTGAIIPATPLDPIGMIHEDEEEVDVVEQLYGADLSVRLQAAVLNDSITLPAVRKNKLLDMEAWAKPSSAPASPALTPQASQIPFPEHIRTLSESRGLHTLSSSSHHVLPRTPSPGGQNGSARVLSLEDYSERMRTAAVMLAQLNSNVIREPVTTVAVPGATPSPPESNGPLTALRWIPGSSWLSAPSGAGQGTSPEANPPAMRMRLQRSEAQAIRDRIMQEMLALEEERMERMRAPDEGQGLMNLRDIARSAKTIEDEGIIRRELDKVDPSAAVFRESWGVKKVGLCGSRWPACSTMIDAWISESDQGRLAVRTPCELGLRLRDCEDGRGPAPGTAGCAADPGVWADMEGRKLSLLGPTVSAACLGLGGPEERSASEF